MKLQKGSLIRNIRNKEIAKELIEKCGYKEVKENKEQNDKKDKK